MARVFKRLESTKNRLIAAVIAVFMPVAAALVVSVLAGSSKDSVLVVDGMSLALFLLQAIIIAPKYLILWLATLFTFRNRKAVSRSFVIVLGLLAVYDIFTSIKDFLPDYSYMQSGIAGVIVSAPPSFIEAYGWVTIPALAILLFVALYFILARNSKKRA